MKYNDDLLVERNYGIIITCDYFKWLNDLQDSTGHYNLRRKYLEDNGFIVGVDHASPYLMELLKTIHSHYYWLEHQKKRIKI